MPIIMNIYLRIMCDHGSIEGSSLTTSGKPPKKRRTIILNY